MARGRIKNLDLWATLVCPECSNTFDRYKSDVKRAPGLLYCSKSCRSKGSGWQKPRRGQYRKCEACEQDFYAKPYDTGKRFCSRACVNKSTQKRIVDLCLYCNKEFEHWPSDGHMFCDRECYNSNRQKQRVNTSKVTDDGYVLVYRPDSLSAQPSTGFTFEHRYIMEQHIGRQLLSEETVHHKNGVRTDNHLDNLELWSSSHPKGQRVQDKLEWARRIVSLYGDLPV